jgi:hypothetical protein
MAIGREDQICGVVQQAMSARYRDICITPRAAVRTRAMSDGRGRRTDHRDHTPRITIPATLNHREPAAYRKKKT